MSFFGRSKLNQRYYKIETHKRFSITVFIRTKYNKLSATSECFWKLYRNKWRELFPM